METRWGKDEILHEAEVKVLKIESVMIVLPQRENVLFRFDEIDSVRPLAAEEWLVKLVDVEIPDATLLLTAGGPRGDGVKFFRAIIDDKAVGASASDDVLTRIGGGGGVGAAADPLLVIGAL